MSGRSAFRLNWYQTTYIWCWIFIFWPRDSKSVYLRSITYAACLFRNIQYVTKEQSNAKSVPYRFNLVIFISIVAPIDVYRDRMAHHFFSVHAYTYSQPLLSIYLMICAIKNLLKCFFSMYSSIWLWRCCICIHFLARIKSSWGYILL